jgi:hypothetical protein
LTGAQGRDSVTLYAGPSGSLGLAKGRKEKKGRRKEGKGRDSLRERKGKGRKGRERKGKGRDSLRKLEGKGNNVTNGRT